MFNLGRKKPDPIKHCNIYMHLTDDVAIVSVMHKTFGIYDCAGGSTKVSTVNPTKFGEAVTAAFDQFQLIAYDNNAPAEQRELDASPALIASGLKTKKAFERDYMRIGMAGANEANIIYLLETNYVVEEVQLRASCGDVPKLLGARLLMLKKYYRQFSAQVSPGT
ncbi:MAG: hypothetical protein WA921_01500 [Ahrensia sp.]